MRFGARAYYNQPVWKRIVVIGAGPAVNIALAFLLVWFICVTYGQATNQVSKQVASVEQSTPAARVLKKGDQLVSVNGIKGSAEQIRRQIDSTHCAGPLTNGCVGDAAREDRRPARRHVW